MISDRIKKFIQLRAKGNSIETCSKKIACSKPTGIKLNRDYANEIAEARNHVKDLLEEKIKVDLKYELEYNDGIIRGLKTVYLNRYSKEDVKLKDILFMIDYHQKIFDKLLLREAIIEESEELRDAKRKLKEANEKKEIQKIEFETQLCQLQIATDGEIYKKCDERQEITKSISDRRELLAQMKSILTGENPGELREFINDLFRSLESQINILKGLTPPERETFRQIMSMMINVKKRSEYDKAAAENLARSQSEQQDSPVDSGKTAEETEENVDNSVVNGESESPDDESIVPVSSGVSNTIGPASKYFYAALEEVFMAPHQTSSPLRSAEEVSKRLERFALDEYFAF